MKVLIKGCVTIFAVILIVALVLFGAFYIEFGVSYIDIEFATTTVNQFMSAMDNRDIDTAYSLFATRTKKTFPIAEFKKALVEENFEVYTGYEKLGCLTLQFDTGDPGPFPTQIRIPGSYPQPIDANKPSDIVNPPLGKTIAISGSIHYKDGYNDKTGILTAFMEREDSGWRILLIYPLIKNNSCKE